MKVLTGLLFYNFANSIAMILVALRWGNNMILLHLYVPIAYALIATLFSYWHQKRPAHYMRLSIPFFIAIYLILLAMGYEDFKLPNKYALSIMSLLVAIITLCTLISILQRQSTPSVYRDDRLWVSAGTFSHYACGVIVFSNIPMYITLQLWLIHQILAIIGNLLYLRAYLGLRK